MTKIGAGIRLGDANVAAGRGAVQLRELELPLARPVPCVRVDAAERAKDLDRLRRLDPRIGGDALRDARGRRAWRDLHDEAMQRERGHRPTVHELHPVVAGDRRRDRLGPDARRVRRVAGSPRGPGLIVRRGGFDHHEELAFGVARIGRERGDPLERGAARQPDRCGEREVRKP